jgi:hypothetical protein
MTNEIKYRVKVIIEEYNDTLFNEVHSTVNTCKGIKRLKHYIIAGKVWAENFIEKELKGEGNNVRGFGSRTFRDRGNTTIYYR